MTTRVVNKSAFTIAGITIETSMKTQDEDAYSLFQQFIQPGFIDSIPNKVDPSTSYSLHTEWSEKDETYRLTLGYEIRDIEKLPTHLDVITIPATEYTVFTAVGELPDASIEMWEHIAKWRRKMALRKTGIASFEVHDSRSRQGPNSQIDIYIPSVAAGV